MNPKEQKIRWRLILGDEADEVCGGLNGEDADRDAALEYLYGREGQGRNRRTSRGGKGSSNKGSLLLLSGVSPFDQACHSSAAGSCG